MSEPSLFPDLAMPAAERSEGPFAKVAIERSLDKTLDYSVPKGLAALLRVGQRVRVPLGRRNKPVHGYVVAINPTAQYATTKPIAGIDDERVLITPGLLELARWMSRYYCTPLGTVLESVIPSAVKKKVGLDYTPVVRLAQSRDQIQAMLEKTKARKRRSILARLLQLEEGAAIDLVRLAGESGTKPPTVRKLARLGIISITQEPDFIALGASAPAAGAEAAAIPELNEDQRRVFAELSPRVVAGGFSVNLLHGVTGSGKTEIYLRCIEQVVAAGRQAIVLVPEIALTPQTVRRFTARFGRVAILHSGLGASQRHRFWQQIAQGKADVVVGARSAVFAPVPNLGIIVVDEEHEASYKQDTAPRYNGRDVAVKRAQTEKAPIILGSATPSLETWWKTKAESEKRKAETGGTEARRREDSKEGRKEGGQEEENAQCRMQNAEVNAGSQISDLRSEISDSPLRASVPPCLSPPQSQTANRKAQIPYFLLSLPRRVRGLQMPAVELVDMRQQLRMRKGIHLISQRLEHLLKVTIQQGHQAILLLNRRGYANFVYCPSCLEVVNCKYCDATMTYHRSAAAKAHGGTTHEGVHTGQLHCHYCLAVNPLPERCPACGKLLSLFGLGTQRVEEELTKKFPDLRFARVDGDTMHSARDYEATLGKFGRGEIQVMLGTQMIAKGLDYPNVTLVGVISGDTALALPDFRAGERTFQLITQVAGRAGRGDSAGRVVLQTFLPTDRTIQAALKHDYEGFAAAELRNRQEVGLPPVTRMVRIILRDQELEKLHELCQEMAGKIAQAIADCGLRIAESGEVKHGDTEALRGEDYKEGRREGGEERAESGEQKEEMGTVGSGLPERVSPSLLPSLAPSSDSQIANRKPQIVSNPQSPSIVVKGPMPCPINRIAGYHRHQIVLFSPQASVLQRVLAMVRKQGGFATSDRIAVDVDPVSLL